MEFTGSGNAEKQVGVVQAMDIDKKGSCSEASLPSSSGFRRSVAPPLLVQYLLDPAPLLGCARHGHFSRVLERLRAEWVHLWGSARFRKQEGDIFVFEGNTFYSS